MLNAHFKLNINRTIEGITNHEKCWLYCSSKISKYAATTQWVQVWKDDDVPEKVIPATCFIVK